MLLSAWNTPTTHLAKISLRRPIDYNREAGSKSEHLLAKVVVAVKEWNIFKIDGHPIHTVTYEDDT